MRPLLRLPSMLLFLTLLSLQGCNKPSATNPSLKQATVTPTSQELGKALFEGTAAPLPEGFVACKTCHLVTGDQNSSIGPNLMGVATRAGTRVAGLSVAEYLRHSIAKHDEYVVEGFEPNMVLAVVGKDYAEILTPTQLDDLVAYLIKLNEK